MATEKQKRVAQLLMAGNVRTVKEAMLKAGYSENFADQPSRVTKSEGFLSVLEDAGVTEEKLADVLTGGLNAEKDGMPDHAVRHKYLETGLKARHLLQDKGPITVNPILAILAQYGGGKGEDIGELPSASERSSPNTT